MTDETTEGIRNIEIIRVENGWTVNIGLGALSRHEDSGPLFVYETRESLLKGIGALRWAGEPEYEHSFTCPQCGCHEFWRSAIDPDRVHCRRNASCGWSGPYSEHVNNG